MDILARVDPAFLADRLIALASDPPDTIPYEILLRLLGDLGLPRAVPTLLEYQDDFHVQETLDIIAALGRMGSPEAIPLIRRWIAAGNTHDNHLAPIVKALFGIGQEAALEVIEQDTDVFASAGTIQRICEEVETRRLREGTIVVRRLLARLRETPGMSWGEHIERRLDRLERSLAEGR